MPCRARFAAVLLALLAAACGGTGPGLPNSPGTPPATAEPAGAYVLLLRDSTVDPGDVARDLIGQLADRRIAVDGRVQRSAFTDRPVEGLTALRAAVVTVAAADARELAADARVAAIEPVRPLELLSSRVVATSSWALDRIDQAALPLDGRTTRYTANGTGVRLAIFDTGIRWTHAELTGRVTGGFDAFTGTPKTSGDGNGHGTFVASLAAGTNYGTAPGATLLDVRVMNAQGSGTTAELVRAADWTIAEKRRVAGPMVVNMSLGIRGGSAVADSIVARLRAAGITVVVAAGNDGADACGTSPARVPGAVTVGATQQGTTDQLARFSNFGSCVDLLAPGASVPGAGASADQALVQGSGTSMASPLVAGAAAAYLSVNRAATPDAAAAWLVSESVSGALSALPAGTPNRLVSLRREPVSSGSTPTPTPTPTPTAPPAPAPTPAPPASTGGLTLTSSCTGRTCTLAAGIPAGYTATTAATLTYVWRIGPTLTIGGTNLRQQTIVFGGPATLTLTVEARRGTTVVGSASRTLTVQ